MVGARVYSVTGGEGGYQDFQKKMLVTQAGKTQELRTEP